MQPRDERDSASLRQSLNAIFDTRSTQRIAELSAGLRLRWFYERDRLIGRYGLARTLAIGGGGHAPWLVNEGVPAASVPSPNILKANCDAVVAWIFGESPDIAVRADGATFEDQYSIEEYELALDSLFNVQATKMQMLAAATDASLTGKGYAMPVYDRGRLTIRRLQGWQVHFNRLDTRDQNPQSVHVLEYRSRASVMAWVKGWGGIPSKGKKLQAIKNMVSVGCRSTQDALWSIFEIENSMDAQTFDADRVMVRHSWKCADGDKSPGRYVAVVQGAADNGIVVIDQDFMRPTLPVVWLLPDPAAEGIEGTGFGHLMVAFQEVIDRLMLRIQRSLDRYGWIKILTSRTPAGAANKKRMAEENVAYLEIDGAMPGGKPLIIDQQVVRPEDVAQVSRMMEMAGSVYGTNPMMQRGATQLGANASGQALQEEFYRGLDRFTPMVEAFYMFKLRLAEELLHLVDDVRQMDPDFAASYEQLGRATKKTWKDLTEIRNRCSISLEKSGTAAAQRGGRVARIQEWASQGLIDPSIAKQELLTDPDTRAAARLALAPIRMVEWQIRGVIEGTGDMAASMPNTDTDLALAIQRVTAVIQLAYVEGAEDETIARLKNYKTTAEQMLLRMQPPAPIPSEPAPDVPLPGV
jgi:hypothetical protein